MATRNQVDAFVDGKLLFFLMSYSATCTKEKEKLFIVDDEIVSRNCMNSLAAIITVGFYFATSNSFDSDFSSLSEALTLA